MPLLLPFCNKTAKSVRLQIWQRRNSFVLKPMLNWCLLDSSEPVFVQLPSLEHSTGFLVNVQRRAVQESAGGRPVWNITPTRLVSNQLPVNFLCLHLNPPMTDTDPPWILSVLTKLFFQPALAIVQVYFEFFYSPTVKLRFFQYLIFKIWGIPAATGIPNKSHKTC